VEKRKEQKGAEVSPLRLLRAHFYEILKLLNGCTARVIRAEGESDGREGREEEKNALSDFKFRREIG